VRSSTRAKCPDVAVSEKLECFSFVANFRLTVSEHSIYASIAGVNDALGRCTSTIHRTRRARTRSRESLEPSLRHLHRVPPMGCSCRALSTVDRTCGRGGAPGRCYHRLSQLSAVVAYTHCGLHDQHLFVCCVLIIGCRRISPIVGPFSLSTRLRP
jgi:hypothetical protein